LINTVWEGNRQGRWWMKARPVLAMGFEYSGIITDVNIGRTLAQPEKGLWIGTTDHGLSCCRLHADSGQCGTPAVHRRDQK
jgi:hypothetical protein